MKKNLNKKLVLKKHTMASLDAAQLKALRGGCRNPDDYGETDIGCETYTVCAGWDCPNF